MQALSDHLFWDVDRSQVDPDKHGAWLAQRVLEHGRWSDWKLLATYYGKERLGQLVMSLRCIDPRSFAFCCAWSQLPPESFRCHKSLADRIGI